MKLTNDIVIEKAKSIGFDLFGFAKADKLVDEVKLLDEWLKLGYHGKMKYMERNIDKRKDVSLILEDAKSVISLAVNYYTDHHYTEDENSGKVSRYAWGKDYHLIIWEMLEELEAELKEIDPGFTSKSYVDTGPVMDKAWAVKAGIGWLGKHTNVINKEIGSWIFIANVITNSEFDYTEPITDYCGSCTACIDACPTDAIVKEYVVDSNKCISYLTIENKSEIDPQFNGRFENWIFGCDICQDVCPWNIKFFQPAKIDDFNPKDGNKEFNLSEINKLNKRNFKERFAESPILRTKLKGLRRNAEFLGK
jgi:epoxyqueuosine reductase